MTIIHYSSKFELPSACARVRHESGGLSNSEANRGNLGEAGTQDVAPGLRALDLYRNAAGRARQPLPEARCRGRACPARSAAYFTQLGKKSRGCGPSPSGRKRGLASNRGSPRRGRKKILSPLPGLGRFRYSPTAHAVGCSFSLLRSFTPEHRFCVAPPACPVTQKARNGDAFHGRSSNAKQWRAEKPDARELRLSHSPPVRRVRPHYGAHQGPAAPFRAAHAR